MIYNQKTYTQIYNIDHTTEPKRKLKCVKQNNKNCNYFHNWVVIAAVAVAVFEFKLWLGIDIVSNMLITSNLLVLSG